MSPAVLGLDIGGTSLAAAVATRVGGSASTARSQEAHMLLGHLLCERVDDRLLASEAVA